MQESGLRKIRYFRSYEARETAFNRSVFNLIPCRYDGPKRFWKDFKQIAASGLQDGDLGSVSYIPSDPRDCLAFGSPLQVLSAACMRAESEQPDSDLAPRRIAAQMGIEALLNQPIRTLSGGESVKLALAKALASSGYSSKLVVSSPFSWLSRANQALFDRVLDRYSGKQIPADILALEGEDDPAPIRTEEVPDGFSRKIAFSLVFSGAGLDIGTLVDSVPDEQSRVRIADFSGELFSPCLLVGDNGQGKSLLAKSLSGAVVTHGEVVVKSAGATGRARLLFQDVITQTLLRSFDGIAASVKGNNRDKAVRIYQRLGKAFEGCPGDIDDRPGPSGSENSAGKRTLLEIKMILIAVRLAQRPPALILDEPDWGLSRRAAILLVAAVVDAAHALDVPVILISHKTWWQPVAGSVLKVEKSLQNRGDCRFEIRLHQL